VVSPKRPRRPSHRGEFEIAIICALPLEFDAVAPLFDEHWDEDGDLYGRTSGDQNTYITGRIDKHNVVLALLPGIGKANAASAAANLRSSYQGVHLTLLVGICGGMSRDSEGEEILLGDVIISHGVVQYDLEGCFPDNFKRKSTLQENLGKVNANVGSFVATLQTDHYSGQLQSRTLHHLTALQRKVNSGEFNYPGIAEDKLFQPAYRHKHQASRDCTICRQCMGKSDPVCEEALESLCSELQCDESQLLLRGRLKMKKKAARLGRSDEVQRPAIHFGLIASGDTVMKSGEDRDRIAEMDKVIAFEMEGAGIWDSLPCIIIKGVCDYADCHKNKKWQKFAAATAASAMKAILERYAQTDRPMSRNY
jgi:nucleoside phosphorylase